MKNPEYINFTLMSIDAWRSDYGWEWNAWYTIEKDIFFSIESISPRRVCNFLRTSGFLSEQSKGKVLVDMHNEMVDGYLIEILDKNTREPIFALSTIH